MQTIEESLEKTCKTQFQFQMYPIKGGVKYDLKAALLCPVLPVNLTNCPPHFRGGIVKISVTNNMFVLYFFLKIYYLKWQSH